METIEKIKKLPTANINGFKYYIDLFKRIYEVGNVNNYSDWVFLTENEKKQIANNLFDQKIINYIF